MNINEYIPEYFHDFENKIKKILIIDKHNIIKKNLNKFKNFSYTGNLYDEYDAVLLYSREKNKKIINKFKNKLIFTNIYYDNINCIKYNNSLSDILKKLYYIGINFDLITKIINNNIDNFNKNTNRESTCIYVPVWGRHDLLKKCLESINNQTHKSIIITICSNKEDYEYVNSLDMEINNFISFNKSLGLKYQFGLEMCKFFYPMNCIIMGSDDIFSENYIENINKYHDKFNIVGKINWKINIINNNDLYDVKYNHSVVNTIMGRYWGGTNSMFKKYFNTSDYGFEFPKIKYNPFSIGAGRSIKYTALNSIRWDLYNDIPKGIDTYSLYKLIIINKLSYINLNSDNYYITSLKDLNIDMITSWEKYKQSKNILIKKI